jgi:hypothetical protein
MGGAADDPVARLVGTLSGLGKELDAIADTMRLAANHVTASAASRDVAPWLAPRLDALTQALAAQATQATQQAAPKPADTESWLGPRLDNLAAWLADSLRQQRAAPAPAPSAGPSVVDVSQVINHLRRIEASLEPVAGADTVLANKMVQIIELLEQLNAQLDR